MCKQLQAGESVTDLGSTSGGCPLATRPPDSPQTAGLCCNSKRTCNAAMVFALLSAMALNSSSSRRCCASRLRSRCCCASHSSVLTVTVGPRPSAAGSGGGLALRPMLPYIPGPGPRPAAGPMERPMAPEGERLSGGGGIAAAWERRLAALSERGRPVGPGGKASSGWRLGGAEPGALLEHIYASEAPFCAVLQPPCTWFAKEHDFCV